MIERFNKVTNGLYRGGAPTPTDVLKLHKDYGIKKIVSLDKEAGDKIERTCKMLGIKHERLPIDSSKTSLIKLFRNNLKDLLIKGGPTFVHCQWGKDRTGLLVAIFKIKYMGYTPHRALQNAKALGFGINVSPSWVRLYEKLILGTKPAKDAKDSNHADIVSNERDGVGDNKDSYLDQAHQGSFSPYLSETRQYPEDMVYNSINDQSPTRENYKSNKPIKEHDLEEDVVPQVGTYDNGAGMYGAGPVFPSGGFITE